VAAAQTDLGRAGVPARAEAEADGFRAAADEVADVPG
jgi:hypothetical protein